MEDKRNKPAMTAVYTKSGNLSVEEEHRKSLAFTTQFVFLFLKRKNKFCRYSSDITGIVFIFPASSVVSRAFGAGAMPWRCCVPGCKGYDEARSMGVIFHGLPTRDPPRCRAWLRAIRNPRFDERTPASRYGGVRVCSLHFQPDDYEEDFRAKILNVAPKPALKSRAVPTVFPGRGRAEPAGADAHAQTGAPERSSAQATAGATGSSSQPPPAAEEEESFCIVVSVDPRDDEFNATTASDEDEDEAVVCGRSLMQLFRRCQTCGQPVADAQLLHAGARVTVRWRCHGGHAGLWDSTPRPGDDPRP